MKRPNSQRTLLGQTQFDAIKAALLQPSPVQDGAAATAAAAAAADRPLPESLQTSVPELPSTVPDSQLLLLNAESQLQELLLPSVPLPPSTKAVALAHIQKMTSQGSDAATQELSPSHFEAILQRNRSLRLVEPSQQDREDETQFTLHEGDEGHIDLVSSLVSQLDPEREDLDSDPVDFWPTQTQHALSQFPDSQRFKTPATVGKKRRYNGDVIDSPELPRNPLLRGGADGHGHLMGLSQAFAATQADTSPFIPNVTGEQLPSDRPSPNIELQARPVTATSSSPLRPVSSFRRASTEPAARYISVKQSQAERERQAVQRRQAEMIDEDDESDGDLFDESGHAARDRRQREIDERVRKALEPFSSSAKRSARGVSLSKSSPIRGSSRAGLPLEAPTTNGNKSPGKGGSVKDNHASQATESEEETEQEDNGELLVLPSSQVLLPPDDEDKENVSDKVTQVPETTVRLIHIMSGVNSHAEESPSLRHGRRMNTSQNLTTLTSSQPYAIADSQASQSVRQRQTVTQVLKSSAADGGIDFVPQSPASSPIRIESEDQYDMPESRLPDGPVKDHEQHQDLHLQNHTDPAPLAFSNSPRRPFRSSTIPETSSNEQQVLGEKQSLNSAGKQRSSEGGSRGDFETAQSHVRPSAADIDQEDPLDLSSPPIATTPPGQRRKRLAEIAAEPSPLKSQISFNASEALLLDADFQRPIQHVASKEVEREKLSVIHSGNADNEDRDPELEPEECSSPGDADNVTEHPVDDPVDNDIADPSMSTRPRRERRPTSKILDAQSPPLASRSSKWDLDASPKPKSVPILKTPGELKRKARESDKTSDEHRGALSKRLKLLKDHTARTTSSPDSVDNLRRKGTPERIVLSNTPQGDVGNETVQTSSEAAIAPNMVFACFNGKTRAYYPALCLGRVNTNADYKRFWVQWEGYDPDEIDEYGVRSLDLRVGDQVKVNMKGIPKVSYVIRGFKDRVPKDNVQSKQTVTDIHGYETLVVAPKQRKSLPAEVASESVQRVPVSAIYLDSNMWGQMRDRLYEFTPSAQARSFSGTSTPMERASTPSTPPSRSRRGAAVNVPLPTSTSNQVIPSGGLFANMAFAISFEDNTRKSFLVHLIQSQGGLVLEESFLDLLETDSLVLKDQYSSLGFTALLTERHSRKEKFMQALALGLPCLSGKWIEACVKADKFVDWTTYLLPAGESTELDGATRSRILPLSPDPDVLQAKDMIAARPNILSNSRVLVVMGKGKGEVRRKAYLFLIRALGAGNIDMEPDLASAKAMLERSPGVNDPEYGGGAVEWVFVEDRDVEAAKKMFSLSASMGEEKSRRKSKGRNHREAEPLQGEGEGEGEHGESTVQVMGNENIVQSLILGRLWVG